MSRQYCPIIHSEIDRQCERWAEHDGPHRVTIIWVEPPLGPVQVDDIVDAEILDEPEVLDPILLKPDPALMASPEGDFKGLAELREAAEHESQP